MNIGDKVTHVNLLGTIVGVSSNGNPVVEWSDGDYSDEDPANLLLVEVPELPEELNPEKDATEA